MKQSWRLISIIMAVILMMLAGCSSDNTTTNDKDMTDLVIEDDFNFTSSRSVAVNLMSLYKGTFYIHDTEENLLAKGLVDMPDGFHGFIEIPNNVSVVKLRFSEVEVTEVFYDIFDDQIDYFFNGEEDERAERGGPQVYSIFNCIEDLGNNYYNIYFSYYSEYDETVTINTGSNNRFKIYSGEDDRDDDYETIEDWGQPEVFEPGYHYNAFVKENYYWECEEDDDDRDDDDECRIKWDLRGTYGKSTSASYAYQDDDYYCPRGEDFDDDGVMDADDDFPDDSDRAYLNYYPGVDDDGWGTLAFEDKWPYMGDYDFNDMVINYRFETIDNGSDELFEVYGYFTLRASGASFQNGFALELPFEPDNIENFSLTPDTYLGYEIIPGEDSEIVKFFGNALNVLAKPENMDFANTDEGEDYLQPVDFAMYLQLDDPVDEADLDFGLPYNPFIILDNNPQMEVHLPDMPPTFNADFTNLNTGDDSSDPAQNRYYKTALNLPWAINIPVQWDYPVERVSILQAYNYFDEWAESSGTLRVDWYENEGDNVVEENLYTAP